MIHIQVQDLRQQALRELDEVSNIQMLEQFRLKYLTKKGPIQGLLRQLGSLEAQQRREAGAWFNQLRDDIEGAFEQTKAKLDQQLLNLELAQDSVDITLPSRSPATGGLHPVIQVLDRILEVLSHMGFCIHLGPNVDDDFHNFEALNFAPDHPARDMQDTFYLTQNLLLRTQTSNTQVRIMREQRPPIRVAVPGRCFRSETITARSHVMFHQVEGLYIDKSVTMADLLATLERFYSELFQTQLEVRVRPSYFPFVEPGIEVDVSCIMCQAKGCSICKQSGWLEVAGAGMVHPNVLQAGGIDPEEFSGFAWGMGIERLVMILNRISDIRLFGQNDMRFLAQFRANR